MGFESLKTSLEQVKQVANVFQDMSKTMNELLGIEDAKKQIEQDAVLADTKKDIAQLQEKEKMKDPEQEKMLDVLAQYCESLLNNDEIKSMHSIFSGTSVKDMLKGYLQEQSYINKELKKGNSAPQQALQKAYDIYDPTTNIQAAIDDISSYYFTQSSSQPYRQTTQHFEQLLTDTDKTTTRKKEFSTHTTETRLKTKPNPDLVRYYEENERMKTKGLAYDINDEKDPQMKTPQSILNHFVSSGVSKSSTGTTLCARTTRLDAERLFHINLPNGNAFDVMRGEQGNFSKSLVSELYNKKEQAKKKVDSIRPNWDLGKNNVINEFAPKESNIADLYVTSNGSKGKIYGHRALMFRVSGQRYVLDPYTAVQPGEDKNKPRTLESYATSMKTGNNKREFMRMNFYKAPVNLEHKAIT